jgi:hypothetical protein
VTVTCPSGNPIPSMAAGATETCTASGFADDLVFPGPATVLGTCDGIPDPWPLYNNTGTATGEWMPGAPVSDTDPSHYCNPPNPNIDIEKHTNGADADDPNGMDVPVIAPNDPVTWEYFVENTGDITLYNVAVTDDRAVCDRHLSERQSDSVDGRGRY